MKKLSILFSAVLMLIFSAGCNTGKSGRTALFERAESTDALIHQLILNKEVPGISLAVFNDEEMLYQKSVGVKDIKSGEPIDSLTAFEAASLSKTVFAYIFLRHTKQHKLTLETPVSSFWIDDALKDDIRHKKLSPLNLLSHTAGLPAWRGVPNLEASSGSELFREEDSLKFELEPNTEFNYSGEGYLYLQSVVEKLSSKSLHELAEEEVFSPLQMNHSSFVFDSTISRNFAIGHNEDNKEEVKYKPQIPLAAASLHTNAMDYTKFLIRLVQEAKTSVTISRMFDPLAEVEEKEDYRILWGLGVGIKRFHNKRYVFHWGDNGVFKSYFIYCLDDNIGFTYFTNSSNGLSIRNKLSRSIFGYDVPMWPANYVN